jgi:hypothetical protein
MELDELEREIHKIIVKLGDIEFSIDLMSATASSQFFENMLQAEQSLRRAKSIVLDNK